MKKAFDANVSRARPKLRLGAMLASEAPQVTAEQVESLAQAVAQEPVIPSREPPADLSSAVKARLTARTVRPSAAEALSTALQTPVKAESAAELSHTETRRERAHVHAAEARVAPGAVEPSALRTEEVARRDAQVEQPAPVGSRAGDAVHRVTEVAPKAPVVSQRVEDSVRGLAHVDQPAPVSSREDGAVQRVTETEPSASVVSQPMEDSVRRVAHGEQSAPVASRGPVDPAASVATLRVEEARFGLLNGPPPLSSPERAPSFALSSAQVHSVEEVVMAQARPTVRSAVEAPAEVREVQTAPVELPGPDATDRRERLRERLKAVRENPRPEPLPETVAEAGVLAVERIAALQTELAKTRAMNLALSQDLEAARRQAERATEEARLRMDEARRLSAEMEGRAQLLSDLEKELSALEGERNEALLALQEARASIEASEREKLELREAVVTKDRELESSLQEEERLASELEAAHEAMTGLRRGADALKGERDTLARQVADLTKERAELLEARKALEAVHRALAKASAVA
ncbi:MAG: hypothetical protein SFW67_30835 [Myxococcaceae bacterium]|nr:hypothetical protein [Myxococcaceae bacterium]